jgi:hypothetical protein
MTETKTGMKDTETCVTEALLALGCVVKYLHLATTLLFRFKPTSTEDM